MALLVFGQAIEASRVTDSDLMRTMLAQVAKRTDERRILQDFLLTESTRGTKRFSEIETDSRAVALQRGDNSFSFDKDPVFDFYIAEMKRQKTTTGLSLYHDLVCQLMPAGNKKQRNLFRKFCLDKIEPTDLPSTFPSQFRAAEILIAGKLRSEIGIREYREHELRKEVLKQLRQVARDMFFAINNGLQREQALNFISLMYELRKTQTALPTNEAMLKKNIIKCLQQDSRLDLIHIKCLRYTYPHGSQVVILDHFEDIEVPDKFGGSYKPRSEKNIFSRLQKLVSLFERYGVSTNLLILIADQDLYDYFPDGGGVFSGNEIEEMYRAMARYRNAIVEKVGPSHVDYLRSYLEKIDRLVQFDKTRSKVILELESGEGRLPERFVEEKVDYRHRSNADILIKNLKRRDIRKRVYAQLASMQALRILGNENDPIIVIEDDRGNDNQFIGGHRNSALPVYFTKLRDKFD